MSLERKFSFTEYPKFSRDEYPRLQILGADLDISAADLRYKVDIQELKRLFKLRLPDKYLDSWLGEWSDWESERYLSIAVIVLNTKLKAEEIFIELFEDSAAGESLRSFTRCGDPKGIILDNINEVLSAINDSEILKKRFYASKFLLKEPVIDYSRIDNTAVLYELN